MAMQALPTPPPSIHYDVNDFRRFFQFALGQLKYNNKYMINDLTTLAAKNQHRMATYIVRDIEEYLRDTMQDVYIFALLCGKPVYNLGSPPEHRLTGFYVIDSICKNLGLPFTELFKPCIERLFLTAYREVESLDESAKVKFEELLGTWRTGATDSTPLFGAEVQRRIEDGVFGSWRRDGGMLNSPAFLSGMNQQPALASPTDKANILFDLRRLLAERERISASYPIDPDNLVQISTLQQLEQLITNQQITLLQVEEMRQHLARLHPPTPAPVQPDHSSQPPMIPQPIVHPQPQFLLNESANSESINALSQLFQSHPDAFLPAAQYYPQTTNIQPNFDNSNSQPHHLGITTSAPTYNIGSTNAQPELNYQPVAGPFPFALDPAIIQQALQGITQLQNPQPPPAALASNLVNPNLFDSQQLAAALASLNPPDNASPQAVHRERFGEGQQHSPAPSTLSNSEVTNQHPDPPVLEYENMVAGLDIELKSSSINRVKANEISEVLYSWIPQFCCQDGSRFLYSKTGNKRASDQLDRHFRLQRWVRESGQRAQQRVWSQLEPSWINSHDFGDRFADKTNSNKTNSRGQTIGKHGEVSADKSMKELKEKYVVRPSSPELANKPCPICQEGFVTSVDQDDGEFYWLNAIETSKDPKKRVIYHATCHYEAIRNKAMIKMKNELEQNRLKRLAGGSQEEGGDKKQKKKKNVAMSSKQSTSAATSEVKTGGEAIEKGKVISNHTYLTIKEESNMLQVDEKFFGADGSPPTPKNKFEANAGSASARCASTSGSTEPKSTESRVGGNALGKRKQSPGSDELRYDGESGSTNVEVLIKKIKAN